jgi:hypothetical protein
MGEPAQSSFRRTNRPRPSLCVVTELALTLDRHEVSR